MTAQDRAVADLIRRLSEAEARGEDFVSFSRQEASAIKQMARFWLAWEAVGFLASKARTILTWVGFMIAAWLAFKSGFFEWVRHGLESGAGR